MRFVRWLVVCVPAVIPACASEPSGTIQLVLSLPRSGDLRPAGLATVAVGITSADGTENVITTPLEGLSFSAGDVPLGEPIQLRVELRDNTNRPLAFGRLEQEIRPDHTAQTLTIPVRKPIVYVSSEKSVVTLDPTRDAVDAKFQGSIANTAGAIAFPIDGTDLGVVHGASLLPIATADHAPAGTAIDLQMTGITDAARVPGERRMVFATGGGLVVANLDTGEVKRFAMAPKPDRVAIGGSAETGVTAFALVGQVAPPTGTGSCTGNSMVYAFQIDQPSELPAMITSGQFSDIAAAGNAVFVSNPCAGTVARIDAGTPAVMMNVGGAAALAIEGERLWAAGSVPGTVQTGARIRLSSIRLDGSDPQEVLLAPKAEVMTYNHDTNNELSLDLHADTLVALDLAVLPGAQHVALLTRMDSHRAARFDDLGSKVIPEMTATVHDIVLADPHTGAAYQRIRARCVLTLIATMGAEFPDWSCIAPIPAEAPAGGEMTPTTVGAQYGGR